MQEDIHFKLKRLNSDVHSPCYLLQLHDVNVLLDCCLDTSSLSYFLPEHQLLGPGLSDLPEVNGKDEPVYKVSQRAYLNSRIQFSMMKQSETDSVFWDTVDVILVSNSRSILGLPFIVEHTNFRGKILSTEPVLKFGKILIDDLINELEQLSAGKCDVSQCQSKLRDLPQGLSEVFASGQHTWRNFYSREAAANALDQIQLVAYHEPVDLFGLLTIKGLSAGYGIGSCNWIISSNTEKVAYISHTSLLYSHVMPFDDSAYGNTDIMIIGTVNLLASNQLERTVEEFKHIMVQTLIRGGHVLVPCNPCGLLFDLLETAIHAKENTNGKLLPLLLSSDNISTDTDSQSQGVPTSLATGTGEPNSNTTSGRTSLSVTGSSSAGQVARSPVFVVSSQVHVSLAYANAYGEWLNPEKESLLYKADAPFPFEMLLHCGQLVALKSLHDSSSNKKLVERSGGSLSQTLSSPLLLGPSMNSSSAIVNSSSSSSFAQTGQPNQPQMDSAMLAMTQPLNGESRNATGGGGLTGGLWPNVPCLIFASHPSLRIGPVVHLIRALTYGRLRFGNRAISKPRHSIILIESGDYVPRISSDPNSPNSTAFYLKQLVSPFLLPNASSDSVDTNPIVFSKTGTAAISLSDTATVYWLPMEAPIGLSQISDIVARAMPRHALILPEEASTTPLVLPDGFASPPFTVHPMACGQKLCFNLPNPKSVPVYLSSQLVDQIQPVFIDRMHSKLDPRLASRQKQIESGNEGPTDSKLRKIEDNNEERLSASSKSVTTTTTTAASTVSDSVESRRTCVAFVNGYLVTQDGLNSLSEKPKKNPDEFTRMGKKSVRPPTPLTSTDSSRSENVDRPANLAGRSRVLVSHQPRIDPNYLIQKLTERGVTGAYLADRLTARQVAWRFPSTKSSQDQIGAPSDVILFPNPNTLIKLWDHGSHIITMDDSTRSTIRDTLLACLQQLEASGTNSS